MIPLTSALRSLRSRLTKRQRQKGSPIFHANRSPTPLPHSPNADSRQSTGVYM
ncbi:hypothetical protein LguiB_027599 [Lonicera macranthoides]